MRILLVGNYALDEQMSMLRYAEMLLRGMTERGHEVEIIAPQAYFGRLRSGPAKKWLRYIDKHVIFPGVLRRRARDFDLVHVCDHSNAMYLPHVAGRPKSITCHDLLAVFAAQGRYPQLKISRTGKALQRWIRKSLEAALRVVCVSQATAGEFAQLNPRADQLRTVIHSPLNHAYRPAEPEAVAEVRAQTGLATAEPYFLHVGQDSWYKNRPGVVRIYALLVQELKRKGRPVPRLVLAGKAWSREIQRLVAEKGLSDLAIECVRPENEQLQALYTGAQAFLFPSLYEGFGWPILEAQSCGCPVITSNRMPMTEVAGAGALLIDPEDEAGAARRIADGLDDLRLLREAGFDNLKRFDLDDRMKDYEDFFLATARAGERAS